MRVLALLFFMSVSACVGSENRQPSPAGDAAAARGVLDTWITHLEAGHMDSLPALLTPEFQFVMEGKRYAKPELMALLRSFGATDMHVYVDSVTTRVRGDIAYLVYSDSESYRAGGVTATAHEVGSIVAERDAGKWRISQWTVTSPPPPTNAK
jgi:uncharacterized protein DUF4440